MALTFQTELAVQTVTPPSSSETGTSKTKSPKKSIQEYVAEYNLIKLEDPNQIEDETRRNALLDFYHGKEIYYSDNENEKQEVRDGAENMLEFISQLDERLSFAAAGCVVDGTRDVAWLENLYLYQMFKACCPFLGTNKIVSKEGNFTKEFLLYIFSPYRSGEAKSSEANKLGEYFVYKKFTDAAWENFRTYTNSHPENNYFSLFETTAEIRTTNLYDEIHKKNRKMFVCEEIIDFENRKKVRFENPVIAVMPRGALDVFFEALHGERVHLFFCLGKSSRSHKESVLESGRHLVALTAPGSNQSIKVHDNPCPAVMGFTHDLYHIFLILETSPNVRAAFRYHKNLLIPKNEWTSDTWPLIDFNFMPYRYLITQNGEVIFLNLTDEEIFSQLMGHNEDVLSTKVFLDNYASFVISSHLAALHARLYPQIWQNIFSLSPEKFCEKSKSRRFIIFTEAYAACSLVKPFLSEEDELKVNLFKFLVLLSVNESEPLLFDLYAIRLNHLIDCLKLFPSFVDALSLQSIQPNPHHFGRFRALTFSGIPIPFEWNATIISFLKEKAQEKISEIQSQEESSNAISSEILNIIVNIAHELLSYPEWIQNILSLIFEKLKSFHGPSNISFPELLPSTLAAINEIKEQHEKQLKTFYFEECQFFLFGKKLDLNQRLEKQIQILGESSQMMGQQMGVENLRLLGY